MPNSNMSAPITPARALPPSTGMAAAAGLHRGVGGGGVECGMDMGWVMMATSCSSSSGSGGRQAPNHSATHSTSSASTSAMSSIANDRDSIFGDDDTSGTKSLAPLLDAVANASTGNAEP